MGTLGRIVSLGLSLSAAATLGGCTIVLGLDQLQGGDTSALDASTDAGRDAALADVALMDVRDASAPPDDTGAFDGGELDTGVIDGGLPETGVPDAGGDAGVPTVGVTGTVVGLPVGRSLRVGNAGTEVDVAGAASGTFTFRVPVGAGYAISIVSAPSELLCVLYRGAGTASAEVTDVFIGCSTAMDLVSWFPFDGSAAAARGATWTTTSGTLGYTADRIGRTGMALAAVSASDHRLVRPLDGRSDVIAPLGTQFTVSQWVRVPASVPASGGDALFGHGGEISLATEVQINWRGGAPYADLYFYWDGGFDRVITSSTTALVRDRWHHVTVSAAGPGGPSAMFERRIYVDGVREGTTATCCGWGNDTQYWMLGAARIQRDDLRLYSRMLSDAEVAGIYAAENVP